MALQITAKYGEEISIGENIKVILIDKSGGKQVGMIIVAPKEYIIKREFAKNKEKYNERD